MSIRRFQYQIDYVHILTFKEQYKDAVAPYFNFDKVEYAIENENTILEGIKLVFREENMVIVVNKQSIIFLFEGNVNELKNQNGPIKIFWEIYEKLKGFKNYYKTTRHLILAHSVTLREKELISSILNNNPYFSINPFGKLEEFACIYEFQENEISYKIHFGNYSPKDIKIQDLMPFTTSFNKDLLESVGLMARLEASEKEKSPSFSKFKNLLKKVETNFSF